MSGYSRRSLKRKMEEPQGKDHRSSKAARESSQDVENERNTSVAPTLITLTNDSFIQLDTSRLDDHEDERVSEISLEEEHGQGCFSQGTMWRGDAGENLHTTQVYLSCRRSSNKESFDCATQTVHFRLQDSGSESVDGAEGTRRTTLDSNKSGSGNIRCCIEGCESKSEVTDSSVTYIPIPSQENIRSQWTQMLDISPNSKKVKQIYVCSQHMLSPTKLPKTKARTRKKKTCDMLLAEEAEKIKQGLASGRPKRTPKPNKNYDWAELIPLIKSEPQDPEEYPLDSVPKTPVPQSGIGGHRRKPLFATVKKEDKENERPEEDEELGAMDTYESEPEDYGENVSQPSQPRFPPPKPKGRPPRIRDMCSQTDAVRTSTTRQPLREVKVQCHLAAEPRVSCSSCSNVDWQRLEELLADCLPQIQRELCDPQVAACIKEVLSNAHTATHATNVLQLLCGGEREELESSKGIILVSSQEDLEEVEIENMIHPEVEAPVSGLREITPKAWRRRPLTVKVKQEQVEEVDDDADDLGIQAATELDDEEFNPALETQEEDDQEEGDDDEEWDVKNAGDSGLASARKKYRRMHQKPKKEQMLEEGEAGARQESSSHGDPEDPGGRRSSARRHSSMGRRKRPDGDMRWIRQEHPCNECNLVFTTQRKFDLHFNHVHLGVAPWQGHHPCDDCGKIFSQKISLNVHKMFKHGAPRRYSCKKCSYEGPTKEYLKRHMKVHTDERQFVCKECGKGLKTAESYRNHMVIHTNEGRFFCEICNKAYNHKGAYEDHIRSHQDERDYACNYCGASFKAYKHVARHIRAVHLNDKRFICDVCGVQHMTGFNLKGHMKKHGDISSLPYAFECSGCEAKFRGVEGLAAHKRVVHNVDETIDTPEEPSESLARPHPTRRPVKFHYSRISSGEATTKSEIEAGFEAIYVEDENYVVYDAKGDNVVYEVYSDIAQEEGQAMVEAIVSEENYGERVIHVYTCTSCNTMFTSEALLEEHQGECRGPEDKR